MGGGGWGGQGCGGQVGRKLQNLDVPEDEQSLGKAAGQASYLQRLCHFLSARFFLNALQCLSFPIGGALDFVAVFSSGRLGQPQLPSLWLRLRQTQGPFSAASRPASRHAHHAAGCHGLKSKSFSRQQRSTECVQCPELQGSLYYHVLMFIM